MKSYKDVTIKDYKVIQDILRSDEPEMIKSAHLIAFVCNIMPEEVSQRTVKENAHRTEFLNDDGSKYKLRKRFWLRGRLFRVQLDARRIKFGRYVDVMNTIKAESDPDAHTIKNMEKLLAIICDDVTPLRRKLDYHEKCALFESCLTMDVVLPITLFFSRVLTNLTPHIVGCLADEVIAMQKRVDLQSIGDGS